ncbi:MULTISPECIES: extracellular solute-binding protein [unclassified Microbacterium]|uniref:sugar ABC transporter substrate-binding protein n=1 Tax=unclassified Microbacterium TaxID=2609290 RepID=UPI00214CE456|nr:MULTISPECIES: extracellular solute-binding protein [unclassified Microbacterium]MCR2784281.1 extracellular solute-binding protein [Microbacterium sp. zg.B96]MDL5350811.1 extracellular solute-binding protein [Microbacterium sp. zg-YB36]WIM14891.1 extracellular solute-binding protein [Microbacterium sp. zg-B96]
MRKLGLGVVALASTAILLAGCSGGSTPEESDTAEGSGAELTIWTDENREPAIQAAAEAFEEETGAKINLVQKNFEDIRADFIAQVPTGEGPDLTIGAHDWLGSLVAAGVVDTLDLGEKASSFEQVAVDAMTYDGQLYALPYSLETIALVQNTDLVGEEAPATWDDMVAAATAAGAARPIVINTVGQKGDAYTMYGFQTSFGAPVFVQDDTGSYTAEVGMGGPAGEAFATWLGGNGDAGTGIISTTIDYDTNNELFATGEAAYTVQGPWAIEALTAQGVNVKVNPIPTAGGETAAPFVGVQGFYLSSQSENALLAQEFLTNYIATDEAQKALYDADPRIPAWSTLAEEVSGDPIIGGFVASSQNGVPMPSIPEMGAVWDLWNAAQVQIINGADPVSTWNQMVTDVETAVAG